MCSVSKPKAPALPPVEDSKEADEKIVSVRDDEKKKAARMLGRSSTILTGASGLSDKAVTVKKSLLGE